MKSSRPFKQCNPNAPRIFKKNALKPASSSYPQLIKKYPPHADTLHRMGEIALAKKNFARAAAYFLQALKNHDANAMDYYALGNTFIKMKKFKPAESALLKAMQRAPRHIDIVLALATLMKRRGRIKAAAACYERAISLNPSLPDLYLHLGTLQNILEQTESAAFNFQVAWEMDPDNMTAKHMLAALRGQTTDAPPKQHVRNLFNHCSEGYELHMVDKLSYRVPELMANLLDSAHDAPRFFENALDLGCGTGLCGMAFRGQCRRLSGIDLSPKMVEMAEKKFIYDTLYVGNILEISSRIQISFDLFIAADVLVYLGNLTPLFQTLATCARPRSFFLFSTESLAGEGYRLRRSGRYGHTPAYVETTAGRHGFHCSAVTTNPIRKEKGKWITGNIWMFDFVADAAPSGPRGHDIPRA